MPFLKFTKKSSTKKVIRQVSAETVKKEFLDTVESNPEKAVELINSRNLNFSSLFLLEDEIKKYRFFENLDARNQKALDYIKGKPVADEYDREYHDLLRWVLETGYADDGLNDNYDEIMDNAAITLTKVYKDRQCLPFVEDMIFKRYRKGYFIYDLVWAYFETAETDNLLSVAKRLLSSEQKDVELARKFLNFVPGLDNEGDPVKQYNASVKWLKDNKNFIAYTGETFLQTNNPVRYSVSLEAKYLQRSLKTINLEQTRSLPGYEGKNLETFKNLDDDLKLRLSDFSDRLSRKSKYRWNRWFQSPVDKQIEMMEQAAEGKND